MPPAEEMDRNQHAVLWPAGAVDDSGDPVLGPPVELEVRWTFRRSQIVSQAGDPIAVDAQVVVDRVIPMKSRMLKVRLADYDPDAANAYMIVLAYNESPSRDDPSTVARSVSLGFMSGNPQFGVFGGPARGTGKRRPSPARKS